MDYALVALAAFLAGAFLAAALILLFRHKLTKRGVGSVTWFLFVFTDLDGPIWGKTNKDKHSEEEEL